MRVESVRQHHLGRTKEPGRLKRLACAALDGCVLFEMIHLGTRLFGLEWWGTRKRAGLFRRCMSDRSQGLRDLTFEKAVSRLESKSDMKDEVEKGERGLFCSAERIWSYRLWEKKQINVSPTVAARRYCSSVDLIDRDRIIDDATEKAIVERLFYATSFRSDVSQEDKEDRKPTISNPPNPLMTWMYRTGHCDLCAVWWWCRECFEVEGCWMRKYPNQPKIREKGPEFWKSEDLQ